MDKDNKGIWTGNFEIPTIAPNMARSVMDVEIRKCHWLCVGWFNLCLRAYPPLTPHWWFVCSQCSKMGMGWERSNQGVDGANTWVHIFAVTRGRGCGVAMCKSGCWGLVSWSGYKTMVEDGLWGSNQGVFARGRGRCAPHTKLSPQGSVFNWGS